MRKSLYHVSLVFHCVLIDRFVGAYHAVCGPCGTLSPRFQCVYGCRNERGENGDVDLCADDLVLCGK